MNRRTLRYITKALEVSLTSNYERIKIGAIIVDGNYIVAQAANSPTTHPKQHRYNRASLRDCPHPRLHAEVAALVRSKRYDLSGCEIFVGRYLSDGTLGNCRPCKACELALRSAGIRRASFTHPGGISTLEYY